jgi:hypothetical protein
VHHGESIKTFLKISAKKPLYPSEIECYVDNILRLGDLLLTFSAAPER